MKKLFSKELLIGLTVLITLLVLFFGIDYLKGINVFHSANYYYASFKNVEGLAQSAPVTVNGFKVGLVKEISYEYDNPGNILVELSLNRNLKLPKGSQAVLVTDLLGTAKIELKMGSGSDNYSVGDHLEGVNSKGMMDNVSNELMPAISAILPRVDSLLIAVTTIVSDPALLNSVRRLDNIMANLETSTGRLSQVMNQVPGIINSASGTMTNVNGISENLLQISKDLEVVSAELRTLPLDSTFNNINSITRSLDKALADLNSNNSSLGLLLHDPSLYRNLNNSAAHIDSILIDLKKQPKRYIPSIKIF